MKTSMRTNHYEVLGVEPGATTRELKASYRRKLKTVHPDSGGTDEAFEELQTAWSVIGNPSKRREYDSWLEDVRPVMGGSRLAVQQRFEERELAVERAAWEARRAEARRAADARAAAQRAAEEAQRAERVEHVGLQRHLGLGVAALVVLVSVLQMVEGDAIGSGVTVPGLGIELPPGNGVALLVQAVLGLLLAIGWVAASAPTRREDLAGEVRFTHSSAFRIALGILATVLAVVVLGPFLVALY